MNLLEECVCAQTVPATRIAKDYGWSAIRLNRFLRDRGVIYSTGGSWVPCSAYQDKGYIRTKTLRTNDGRAVLNTEWTQDGQRFLYELMKDEGYLPLREQKGKRNA